MSRRTRHSTGSQDEGPAAGPALSREAWNLYPGRDRGIASRNAQRHDESADGDADAENEDDFEEDGSGMDEDDEEGSEEDASGSRGRRPRRAPSQPDESLPPPPPQLDCSRRSSRRMSMPIASYKEKGISDIRRSPSPEPLKLRVGDALEVEVEERGSMVWMPAEVREVKRNGRFFACINGDEEFIEEYGPEDEGSEWRKASKYDGLKRQRKSVDHYQPDLPGAREDDMHLSTKVGPFRQVRERGGEGGAEGGGRSRRGRAGADRESSTDSEGEFDKRQRRSEVRLRGAVQPLKGPDDRPHHTARSAALATTSRASGVGGAMHTLAGNILGNPKNSGGSGGGGGDAGGRRLNAGGVASAGDVQPMAVDGSVDWGKVGGLEGHVEALKEMVLLPLLYPEVFDGLGVTPPRGVLFHGPPGTGKSEKPPH